jgi:predicted unusual protein kinase regulating ubiquinone biosynthesis (AarF/ABC1/UbiB family)
MLPVGRVFMDIVRVAVETGVRMPAEIALLGKTLYNLEAVGHALAPEFNPTDAVRRYAAELLRRRMMRSFSASNMFGSLLELRDLAERLPGRLNRILDAVADNRLGLKLDTGIDTTGLMVSAQKIANRITLGLVLAALIVGAALLMQVETSFRIFGYPGFAILLFLLAAGAAILLLLTIAVKDRR